MILETTFEARDRITIWREFSNVLAKMKPEQKVVLSLSLWKKKRTGPQNRYYWGTVVRLVRMKLEEGGQSLDDEEVHCLLKAHIGKLKRIVVLPDGEERNILLSSTKLTTVEFMDYIEKIRAWAAPFGLIIPEPNEAVYEERT